MDLKCYRCKAWPCVCADGITLIHGDCREVLPQLEPVDLVLTDPPYGYSYESSHAEWSGVFEGGRYTNTRGAIQQDENTDARDWMIQKIRDTPLVCFGNLRSIPPFDTRGVLVWDKGDAAGMGDLSFPWKPNWELIFIRGDGFEGNRTSGVLRTDSISRLSMGRLHPMEKPVRLITQLLAKHIGRVVLDPFAGSGTTLVAAKQLGRKCIGIEIEEKYCQIAANRLRQEVLPFND
jgi:DNA modification methylase